MKFIIETSETPIYNRIAVSFVKTLREFGHVVFFIDPHEFSSDDFINIINNIDIDYYISTNDYNFINQPKQESDSYIFEEIQHKIVFIHHDSSFCKPGHAYEIEKYLIALKKHNSRLFHFFIEKSNIDNFEHIGIGNIYEINHASEFTVQTSNPAHFRHEISFVGHLMSNLNAYPYNELAASHHMISLAWGRTCNSTYSIQPEIWKLVHNKLISSELGIIDAHPLAIYQFYMHEITKLSMAYRGELISMIKHKDVTIYGGDLSHGLIDNPLLKIRQENINYLPPTSDYNLTQSIYNQSKININISSLQFDDAINNRIIDVIMAGGFLITDRRTSLLHQCPTCHEISFESPEEMLFLISYYSDASNIKKYLEIKDSIFNEVKNKFNYEKIIEDFLTKLN